MGLAAISIFGVFLFLTYYLQPIKGFSPVATGLAFLPLALFVLLASTVANVRLLPLLGARALISTGMILGGLGMFYLTRITPSSDYAVHVLPALPVIGMGFGFIVAPAVNLATLGVDRQDAGIASATVNTVQQVGGSIGTALLSTIAASATAGYLGAHTGATAAAHAAVHGYVTAFVIAGSVFIAGGIAEFFILDRRAAAPTHPPGNQAHARTAPITAHA